MIEFVYIWAFVLLFVPLVIINSPLRYYSSRSALRVSFIDDIRQAKGGQEYSEGISRATPLQKLLLGLVWVLLIVAVAKPQYIGEPIIKEESQREILVAVDLSGSMSTQDFKGEDGKNIDRLEAVKLVLADFFEKRKGEKIGLVLFGSAAFVQAPFTQDLDALQTLLDGLQVGMAGPQTMLGDGIALGVKMFRENNVTDRMMIVMSDGDDTGSRIPPKTAAKLAKDNSVNIYTIAVGDPKNAGEHPLDTETLKSISKDTGGQFYYALDRKELVQIYDAIEKLTPKEVKQLTHRPTSELYIYPLALGLFLMFVYALWLWSAQSRRIRKENLS